MKKWTNKYEVNWIKRNNECFGVPFFHIDLISLDWLHEVDLEISLDFIGCFFKYLIDRRWQILQGALVQSNAFCD